MLAVFERATKVTLGYVEVKPKDASNTLAFIDLVRLASFVQALIAKKL